LGRVAHRQSVTIEVVTDAHTLSVFQERIGGSHCFGFVLG